MKKNSTKGYVILCILFALVSIIAFAVPTVKTATFWIAYVFTATAFAAQIIIWNKALGKEELNVNVEKMKDDSIAAMVTLSEEARRMQEMMRMYGMAGMDPAMFGNDVTLNLNANHPLVKYVVNNKESEHADLFCKQLFDLAMLAHKPLNPDEMTAFVNRSNEIMMLLAK